MDSVEDYRRGLRDRESEAIIHEAIHEPHPERERELLEEAKSRREPVRDDIGSNTNSSGGKGIGPPSDEQLATWDQEIRERSRAFAIERANREREERAFGLKRAQLERPEGIISVLVLLFTFLGMAFLALSYVPSEARNAFLANLLRADGTPKQYLIAPLLLSGIICAIFYFVENCVRAFAQVVVVPLHRYFSCRRVESHKTYLRNEIGRLRDQLQELEMRTAHWSDALRALHRDLHARLNHANIELAAADPAQNIVPKRCLVVRLLLLYIPVRAAAWWPYMVTWALMTVFALTSVNSITGISRGHPDATDDLWGLLIIAALILLVRRWAVASEFNNLPEAGSLRRWLLFYRPSHFTGLVFRLIFYFMFYVLGAGPVAALSDDWDVTTAVVWALLLIGPVLGANALARQADLS